MAGKEYEKRRKLVKKIGNFTALTLLASQISGAVKAIDNIQHDDSSITSRQISQASIEKRAKRLHGGSKIESQTILALRSSTSVSKTSERKPQKNINDTTTVYKSTENSQSGGHNATIGRDSNLKLTHENSTGLIRPVDIDKQIREEKEKQGLYKLIALIERFDPQGAMTLIDKLSSAKVSIGALEQQATEIINKNLATLVAVTPIEDIQKITHFDFSSIDQSSPAAAVTEGFVVSSDQKAALELISGEVGTLITNHDGPITPEFVETISDTINDKLNEFGPDLLMGLNATLLALAIGNILKKTSLDDIKKKVRRELKDHKRELIVTADVVLALAIFACAIGTVIATTPTAQVANSPTPQIQSTEMSIAPTAMSLADVVNITADVIRSASERAGVSVISSIDSSLTNEQRLIIDQFQNTPDLKNVSVSGFETNIVTEVISASGVDGTSFQVALSTLSFLQNGQETGRSIYYQFEGSDGNIYTYVLTLINTQHIDGKTIRSFTAIPTISTPGLSLETVIVGVFENDTANDPIVMGLLQPVDNGNLFMPLLGTDDEIQQLAGKANAIVMQIDPTAMPEATVTVPAVTMAELRITDPALIKAFNGIGKFLTPEGGKFTATIGGEKYTLDGGWNLNEKINNFYAPATVNAVDAQGNQVILIWNKEGLSVNTPLSVDIENPTGFSDATKLTTLQRFLLQNPDPFSKRSDSLIIISEKTENGIFVSFNPFTPGKEDAVSKSNNWLLYMDPDGNEHLVNPLNLNTADGRMVNMCAYGKSGTGAGDKNLRERFMIYFNQIKIVKPILKVDKTFFNNFQHTSSPVPAYNAQDLNYLLTLKGNRPAEDLVDKLTPQGDGLVSFSTIIRDLYNSPDLLKVDDYFALLVKQSGIKVDPKIQLMIIPCQMR